MKYNRYITAVLFLVGFSAVLMAQSNYKIDKADYDKIEANLLAGLESENPGLQVSSAYYLGEMESSKAVIPLMRLLRNSESEGVRIISALSLIKIGNEIGVYMVKRHMDFCDNERVKAKCRRFYAAHTQGMINPDPEVLNTYYSMVLN